MPEVSLTVLVTGCSSGIGRAIVQLLASEGYHVFAGVRSHADAQQWESRAGVTPLLLDVTSQEQVDAAVQQIEAACAAGLFALVNNAGMATPSALELTTPEELQSILDVNVVGPHRLTQACLPLLRQGQGRIVNMSSMNGQIALPMVGAYSASKFALEALTDTLRVELKPWGIPLTLIRPGQIRTAIFEKARQALELRKEQVPPSLKAGYDRLYEKSAQFNERGAKTGGTPEQVAAAVLKTLRAKHPRTHRTVGWDAWGLAMLQRFTHQRVFDRLLARASGTLRKAPRQ